tara:strand:+ start:547 stop:1071 length:525 start_codon:yes stop_codon:yes gene_type:complete
MFKRTTTKESKIKDIVKFLKLLPEAQIDQVTEALLYGRISAVSATRLVEPTAQTTKIVESSDEVTETTATKKVNAKVANTKRMSQSKVSKKYKNAKGEDKIGFEKNTLNNFSHAKTGDVDGKFTAFAELSEWLVVSPNPKKKSENRIFFNFIEEELKSDFIKVAKREGFEVSFN